MQLFRIANHKTNFFQSFLFDFQTSCNLVSLVTILNIAPFPGIANRISNIFKKSRLLTECKRSENRMKTVYQQTIIRLSSRLSNRLLADYQQTVSRLSNRLSNRPSNRLSADCQQTVKKTIKQNIKQTFKQYTTK